jgi:hypothetical protein
VSRTGRGPGIERSWDHVVVLHVPKTAGTTVRNALLSRFPSEAVFAIDAARADRTVEALAALPKVRRASLRLVIGHAGYGVHELLPGRTLYVGFVRHPVARLRSLHEFLRRRPEHRLHRSACETTLEQFVTGGFTADADNSQVRHFAGVAADAECGGQDLERAIRHIEQRFLAVGVVEDFETSMLGLWAGLGLSGLPWHVRSNTGGRYRGDAGATSRELRALKPHVELDTALWESCRQRVAECRARGGLELERRRLLLRLANPPWSAWRHVRFAVNNALRGRAL